MHCTALLPVTALLQVSRHRTGDRGGDNFRRSIHGREGRGGAETLRAGLQLLFRADVRMGLVVETAAGRRMNHDAYVSL